MQEFKSKIGSSFATFLILSISFLGLLYLLLFLTTNFRLTQITFLGWLAISLTYFLLAYLYTGLTNNDIFLFDNKIEIVNLLPLFKKHHSFQLDEVKSVKFRHEGQRRSAKILSPIS